MSNPTPVSAQHHAEMRGRLLHHRSNLLQEKGMLLQAQKRIAEIDEHLALIDSDLERYGYVKPVPATPSVEG